MRNRNVSVSERVHSLVKGFAERERVTVDVVMERALEAFGRQRRIEAANEAYAALPKRADNTSPRDRLSVWATTLDISTGREVGSLPTAERPRERARRRA